MYPMLVYNVAGSESLSGHKLAGRFPAGRLVHSHADHTRSARFAEVRRQWWAAESSIPAQGRWHERHQR